MFGLSPLKRKEKKFIQILFPFIDVFANPLDALLICCYCCCWCCVFVACASPVSFTSLAPCLCVRAQCCGAWCTCRSSPSSSSSSSSCTLQPIIVYRCYQRLSVIGAVVAGDFRPKFHGILSYFNRTTQFTHNVVFARGFNSIWFLLFFLYMMSICTQFMSLCIWFHV